MPITLPDADVYALTPPKALPTIGFQTSPEDKNTPHAIQTPARQAGTQK